jgi:hypothetical protein
MIVQCDVGANGKCDQNVCHCITEHEERAICKTECEHHPEQTCKPVEKGEET